MVANTDRREHLLHALEILVSGNSAGFEDSLWLTFGDDWTGVLGRLLERKIVRYNARDDDYAITEHGRKILIHSRAVQARDVEARGAGEKTSA